MNNRRQRLLRLHVRQFARHTHRQTTHDKYSFRQLEQFSYFLRSRSSCIADATTSQTACQCRSKRILHCQCRIYNANHYAIDRVLKWRYFNTLFLCKTPYFVIIRTENEKMIARLYLLLICQSIQRLLGFLIVDIYHRELLTVVTCRCVANSIIDKLHSLFLNRFPFITTDAPSL